MSDSKFTKSTKDIVKIVAGLLVVFPDMEVVITEWCAKVKIPNKREFSLACGVWHIYDGEKYSPIVETWADMKGDERSLRCAALVAEAAGADDDFMFEDDGIRRYNSMEDLIFSIINYFV